MVVGTRSYHEGEATYIIRMRKGAGVILIGLGVAFLSGLIAIVGRFSISMFLALFSVFPGYPLPNLIGVLVAGTVAMAAFNIAGGIFCLRRKYWRVCLASASFAVLGSVVNSWVLLLSSDIATGLISWVTVFAAVIALIFAVRTKKEWREISDSADGKVSYDG